jgi:CHAT domain-containing protein
VIGVGDAAAPRAEDEARAVAAALGGAVLLAGPDATRARVMSALDGARLVHIASHARFVASDPMGSGVKLADGWLTGREIYRLRLDGAAVTLSGCDSGRAAVDAADELLGMVRAFLVAGASAMLISLWPIHDRTTSELMTSVYRFDGVGAGEPRGREIGGAIRQAQLELFGRAPHPAAWAPFLQVGVL